MSVCNDSLPLGHVDLPDFDRAIATLQSEWRAAGIYEPSALRLVYGLAFTACLIALSARWSARRPLLGGFLMGLAILCHFRHAHECGHQKGWHRPQLYSSEQRHATALYVITNLFAGVDGLVWQTEHRLHHAHTLSVRDPQIPMRPGALLPICAVDEQPLARFIAHHPLASTLLRWQEVFFLPFLTLVGKHYLAFLTYRRIDAPDRIASGYPPQDARLRKLLVGGHYALLAVAMWWLVWRPNAQRRQHSRRQQVQCCLLWFVGCSIGAGLVEPMFLFNHVQTGHSKHRSPADKVAQLCHTINYTMRLPRWLPLDELLIPVAYHIEHHIEPKVPDENLPKITDDIKRVASQFGVPFRTAPLEALAWDYLRQLATVPRDRWGGAGSLVPVVLALGAAACYRLCARPAARVRHHVDVLADELGTGGPEDDIPEAVEDLVAEEERVEFLSKVN